MPIVVPSVEQIERDIADLLREQEVCSLATVSPSGAPSVAMIHIAADGLSVYLNTFTYTRKFAAIQRDPRVSYTVAHVPAEGFVGRTDVRAVQVDGIASVVTNPAEIERAVAVSYEQFGWLRDTRMYEAFRNGSAMHQAFFRIDPVQAMWNDNRVHLLWRKIVHFTPDGGHVAAVSPYQLVPA